MTETTYWIIVIAALAAALGIWLLTRSEPPKPAKRAPRAMPPPAVISSEPDVVDEPAIAPAIETAPEAIAPIVVKLRGRPKKSAASQPDELTTLKGLGPKAAARLNALGVTRFDQIAAWSDADVARIAPELGNFRDRVVRDRWVEQAGHLANGDTAGFEAKFGKLG